MAREIHDVRVTVAQPGVGIFGLLFLVFILWYVRYWILAGLLVIALVAGLYFLFGWLSKSYATRQRDQAQLRTRADEQNSWFLGGDPRGMFGHDWRNREGSQP